MINFIYSQFTFEAWLSFSFHANLKMFIYTLSWNEVSMKAGRKQKVAIFSIESTVRKVGVWISFNFFYASKTFTEWILLNLIDMANTFKIYW